MICAKCTVCGYVYAVERAYVVELECGSPQDLNWEKMLENFGFSIDNSTVFWYYVQAVRQGGRETQRNAKNFGKK